MTNLNKLEELALDYLGKSGPANIGAPGYWGSRCVLQLQYASKLSESEGGAYDDLVSGVRNRGESGSALAASI